MGRPGGGSMGLLLYSLHSFVSIWIWNDIECRILHESDRIDEHSIFTGMIPEDMPAFYNRIPSKRDKERDCLDGFGLVFLYVGPQLRFLD